MGPRYPAPPHIWAVTHVLQVEPCLERFHSSDGRNPPFRWIVSYVLITPLAEASTKEKEPMGPRVSASIETYMGIARLSQHSEAMEPGEAVKGSCYFGRLSCAPSDIKSTADVRKPVVSIVCITTSLAHVHTDSRW
jgi:hypothetical protein